MGNTHTTEDKTSGAVSSTSGSGFVKNRKNSRVKEKVLARFGHKKSKELLSASSNSDKIGTFTGIVNINSKDGCVFEGDFIEILNDDEKEQGQLQYDADDVNNQKQQQIKRISQLSADKSYGSSAPAIDAPLKDEIREREGSFESACDALIVVDCDIINSLKNRSNNRHTPKDELIKSK